MATWSSTSPVQHFSKENRYRIRNIRIGGIMSIIIRVSIFHQNSSQTVPHRIRVALGKSCAETKSESSPLWNFSGENCYRIREKYRLQSIVTLVLCSVLSAFFANCFTSCLRGLLSSFREGKNLTPAATTLAAEQFVDNAVIHYFMHGVYLSSDRPSNAKK